MGENSTKARMHIKGAAEIIWSRCTSYTDKFGMV